jgi:hypothetical protein
MQWVNRSVGIPVEDVPADANIKATIDCTQVRNRLLEGVVRV